MPTDADYPPIPPSDTCNARKTKNDPGHYCKLPAGHGTDHVGYGRCKLHGGMLPNVKLFTQKLMIEDEVKNVMGAPLDVDPLTALLELVKSYAGAVLYLQQNVMQLGADELYVETERGIQPSPWVRLHGEYSERLARTAKLALDAGVDERLVRVAEEQGKWLTSTLDIVFAELELTEQQLQALPSIMQRALVQLAPPPADEDVVDAEVVEERFPDATPGFA